MMRTPWPGALDYQEAIQTPEALSPETGLAQAILERNRHGLPIAYTGRFAAVFRFQDHDGGLWAARLFTTQDSHTERAERYRLLAELWPTLPPALRRLFVPFEYTPRGILVGGSWYPLVRMAWAQGTPLGQWVAQNRDQPRELRYLAAVLGHARDDLQSFGIAHGDW